MRVQRGRPGSLGPLLIGLNGTALQDHEQQLLEHPAVGGVILFARNYSDREQLSGLVAQIHASRDPRLLVCVDQEGGRVQRLTAGFTRLPPLGHLGRLHRQDPQKALDMAYRHGRVMATEMLSCGIDLSFAPVLDLDRGSRVIGDRAFSDDPQTVLALGQCYLAGMHDAGMKATGKHFPGHGSVAADSHLEEVVDPRTLDDIQDSDLVPFRALQDSLEALMIAHVVYPAVDSLPAGYSQAWLQDILQRDMGFRGVIFSDDLGMRAARVAGGLDARMRLCLEAGCDLALVCDPEDVRALLRSLRDSPVDATRTVARLYGCPTVDREALAEVNREGIREWSRWQRSLEELGETAWV